MVIQLLLLKKIAVNIMREPFACEFDLKGQCAPKSAYNSHKVRRQTSKDTSLQAIANRRSKPGSKHRLFNDSDKGCGCTHSTRSLLMEGTLANNTHSSAEAKKWQNSSFSSMEEPPREKNTDEQMAHYLLNQILLIVNNLNRFNRERITFLEFLQILRELNMIPPSYQPSNDDEVYDLWAMLCQGNRDLSACLINYAILLLAVVNIKGQPSAIKRFFESVPYLESSRLTMTVNGNRRRTTNGTVIEKPFKKNKEGYFELTQTEVRRIYRTFQNFRVTRMHLGQIGRKIEIIQRRSNQKFPFHPQISNRSRKLASQGSSRKCRHGQYTSRDKENYDECTFQPNSYRSSSKKKTVGIRKSEELYKLGKEKKIKQFNREELQLRNNRQEYTFRPKLTPFSRKNIPQNHDKSKAEDRQINRMRKARIENQIKRAVKKTGMTFSERIYSKFKSQIEAEVYTRAPERLPKQQEDFFSEIDDSLHMYIPEHTIESICEVKSQPKPQIKADRKTLMTIEVFINEGDVHNLVIREGDNPENLAKSFALEHNLDSKMTTQLAKEIQTAIKFSLCQIEQESIECSEDAS